jgi:1-acyl-sn-glycerol-3-phosphate acyltransferase
VFWMTYFLFSILWVGALLAYGLVIPLHLIGYAVPHKFFPHFKAKIHTFADLCMQKGIAFLMRLQPWYHLDSDLNLPENGCLIVSNHRSHLDAFVLLSTLPGIRIFTKQSLFWIPFLGPMMWVSRQIPAKRGDVKSLRQGLELIRERVRQGERVLVFPEMTRCQENFLGVQSFLLAPFQIAFQENLPIVPMVFKNTDRVWPKGQMKLRARGFRPSLSVKVKTLATVKASDFSSIAELKEEVQKRISDQLFIL